MADVIRSCASDAIRLNSQEVHQNDRLCLEGKKRTSETLTSPDFELLYRFRPLNVRACPKVVA
jgi:hypothetical protein